MTNPHRLSLGVVLAAALALLPLAASAAPATRSTAMTAGSTNPALGAPVGALDYSVLLGLELPPSGFSVGPKISGEAMYGFMDLNPQTRLSFGGRAGFGYHGGDFDTSVWVLEAVPDAKIKFAVAPQVALYGDVGLGLALLHVSVPSVVTPFGTFGGGSDSTLAFTFQFGGGVAYAVNPNMNILGEVRLDIYTRSGSSTFVSIPTVGLQFH